MSFLRSDKIGFLATLIHKYNEGGFFYINIVIIKLAGLWVPDQGESFRLKCWYWCYNIIVNGYSIGLFMPSEFLAFGQSRRSLEDAIKNASVAFTHLLAGIKVLVWLKRRKEILKIIEVLEQKASQYEGIDDFQPQETVNEEKRTKNITTIAFLFLCLSVSITAFSGALAILLTDYDKYVEINLTADNITTYRYTQRLPYWAWMPFNYDSSKLRFLMGIIYTCFAPFQQAWVIVGIDTIFTALISYISAQLTILRGAFKTIRPRCLRSLGMENIPVLRDSEKLNAEMMREMNKCVQHLQVIFSTCEKMESIFTYLTLTQVLMSEILICTCLYLVSSIPITSKAFATELVYLVAIELQIALYCFFGNKVTITGENISLALYEGDWLSSSTSFKKSMLITMTRMRRPIYLTMGKFSPLTLSTFVTIGRGSYSFFAVLKNQNIENPM